MTADAGILSAGASKVRHGNRYRADTHERQTALNTDGAPFPAMEVYKFQTLAELKEAASTYVGKVTAIQPGGKFDALPVKEDEEGPIDFFAMQPDSSYVRSNKYGEPTTVLETLKPDHSGVIATGEVGPGSTPSTQTGVPAKLYQSEGGELVRDGSGKLIEFSLKRGTHKWRSQGLGPGSPIDYQMGACKGQVQVRGLPADSAVLTVTFGDFKETWLAGTGTCQANFAAGSRFRIESDRWQEVEIQTDLTQ